MLRLRNFRIVSKSFSSHAAADKYKSVQSLCRDFAKKSLAPVASELDKQQHFPHKQIEQLGKLGLMGITVPEKYGGAGLDIMAASLAVEELSRACAATGAIVSIHNILYADFVAHNGTQDQKEQFLKPYTQGTPGAFALSEAEAGSDAANVSTTATDCGDCYALNGTKTWVTSAQEAEVAIVFAKIAGSVDWRGITAFLVPLRESGVTLTKPDNKLGIRALTTCDIILNDVRIPKSMLVGEVGGGFKLAMHQLNKARIGIASQALGISQAALDLALEYAHCRRAFGKPIFAQQAVKLRLAQMATRIEASRLLVRKAAARCISNKSFIKNSAMAKITASETATFASHQCIQILGAMGYIDHTPAERLYRDARVTEIFGGVSDIQMLIIASQLTK